VAQILITDDFSHRTRYLNARTLFFPSLVENHPVINENDTVAVDEISFGIMTI
jgi:glutamate 5-kinase